MEEVEGVWAIETESQGPFQDHETLLLHFVLFSIASYAFKKSTLCQSFNGKSSSKYDWVHLEK